MLTDQLKEYTKEAHASSEKYLVNLIRQIETKADYAQLLRVFYGYFGKLEYSIGAVLDRKLLSDYADRRRASALLADLEALNAGTSDLETCMDLPQITNMYEVLGALYVYEGSSLGGQFISKMIAERLQVKENKAFGFFLSYGENTGRMWADFKKALNSLALDDEERNQVLNAARATFATFGRWLLSQSPAVIDKP